MALGRETNKEQFLRHLRQLLDFHEFPKGTGMDLDKLMEAVVWELHSHTWQRGDECDDCGECEYCEWAQEYGYYV